MIIANPIYDVVFKYLLDDMEIARELLSTILGEDIVNLDFKPQEMVTETVEKNINIFRVDFKAVIRTPSGETKKLLIELQKAKQPFDVMRFRRYLGDNYRREDDVLNEKGISEKRALPIVTIYFLGFPLDNIQSAVVKINREYLDVITQEIIEVKEDFVELLTHDSYLIQIRKLVGHSKSKLERVLQVFSPEFQTADPHKMDFRGDVNDPLVKKMVERLGRVFADDDIRNLMDVEDEISRVLLKLNMDIEEAQCLTKHEDADQELNPSTSRRGDLKTRTKPAKKCSQKSVGGNFGGKKNGYCLCVVLP